MLSRPEAAADPALFAEALVVAAHHTMFTDMPTSLRLAEQADEVADGLGDDRLLVLSRAMLCEAYYFAGQPARGRPLGLESIERARKLGDDVLLGMSLDAYAAAVGAAASGPLYAEALACAERSGDLATKRTLHTNAGATALELGDILGARAHTEAGIRAAEALGSPHPTESLNLGMILRAEHDLVRYADASRQAAARGGKDAPVCQPVSYYLPADVAERAEALRQQARSELIDLRAELRREAEAEYPRDRKAQAFYMIGELTRRRLPLGLRQVPRGAIARMAVDHWARRAPSAVAGDAVDYAADVHLQVHRARRDMRQLRP